MSQFQGFDGLVLPIPMIPDVKLCLASLYTYTLYSYIYTYDLHLKEKGTFYFSN